MLGVNTLYRLFCFFKLFPMVGKGLIVSHSRLGSYLEDILLLPDPGLGGDSQCPEAGIHGDYSQRVRVQLQFT